jgi:DDE superfamily endonuclease
MFKTTAIDTLKQDKKCQPCWYIILSTMSGSTTIRRRMWTPEGIRPIVTVTGSHQRTCVFGTITIDGKQLFRQYDVFNQYVFLKYLKELQRKFRKLLLFIDRAVQHRSSIMVRKHLEENKDVIRVE